MGKVLVGKISELSPGSLKAVQVPGHDEIVLANVDGTISAMRGQCNHAGGPLAEGTLEGSIITCPWHGAKWDVKTGQCAEFAMDLDPEPVYAVTTEGDSIYIEI
jgi:nitrite reductase/ring-hydroxylating ferredoxin subunit